MKHARVDETGLLLEWGLSDYDGEGIPVPDDFASPVGTVRWNGSAWVDVPQPDAEGFELALHNAFPDQQYLTFLAAFPASWVVVDSIRRGSWSQLQGLIQLALQQGAVTQQQYDAVKAAAAAHNIPVSL